MTCFPLFVETICLRAVAAAAVTGASLTAAPAMAQPGEVWSGPYVGLNAGAIWGDTSARTNAAPGKGPVIPPASDLAAISASARNGDDTSVAGGVEAGYNYRRGSVLFGIETDYSLFDVRQTATSTYPSTAAPIDPSLEYTIQQDLSTDWIWTLRPRLGYVDGPLLLYVTAGLAASRIKYRMDYADTFSPAGVAHVDIGDTKTGWVAGIGSGYAFNRNWSVKGEWLHADFGSVDGSADTPAGTVSLNSKVKVRANLVRFGVDYAF